MSIMLSEHFPLSEFTKSDTAKRMGKVVTVDPESEVFRNMRRLCRTVLEPAWFELGPIHVLSGYRPTWLNTAVGGSRTSDHKYGRAADISTEYYTPLEMLEWFYTHRDLPFDQCIIEFERWIHISIAIDVLGPRGDFWLYTRNPDGELLKIYGFHDIMRYYEKTA